VVRVSILVASRERTTSTTKTFTYNTASQLTNTGYVYDGLGRNTSIPASHSPGSVGVIGLSYRLNDQVASITQNSVTTVYGFDAAGRRVTETSAGSVLTKHYTGTSDNPAWSSNNAGVSDIYTSSLGTGLNSTVHVDNGVKTVSLDVNDLRGNTVTRINLDTASTDSWISVDEYGNREGASTGKLVTYDAYGQYERATTSQGLILMGARVYNPVTNQFTSPDPITGGNETTYTYPNDPINKTDFDGNWGWGDTLGLAANLLIGFGATALFCSVTLGVGCVVGLIAAGAVGGFADEILTQVIHSGLRKVNWNKVANSTVMGAALGIVKAGAFRKFAKLWKVKPKQMTWSDKTKRLAYSEVSKLTVRAQIYYFEHRKK
jgi:RHS repeat-associated protein